MRINHKICFLRKAGLPNFLCSVLSFGYIPIYLHLNECNWHLMTIMMMHLLFCQNYLCCHYHDIKLTNWDISQFLVPKGTRITQLIYVLFDVEYNPARIIFALEYFAHFHVDLVLSLRQILSHNISVVRARG